MIVVLFLLMLLLMVDPALASEGSKIGLKDLLPIVGAGAGALGSIVLMFPLIRRIRRNFEAVVTSIAAWWRKYCVVDSQMVRDFKEVIKALDVLTEDMAKLLRIFGLHKAAKVLQDLIREDMYRRARWK